MPAETERFVIVKIVRRKRDIPKPVFLDILEQHAPLEVIAGMEKAETIRGIPPDRSFGQESDPAIKIVVKVLQIRTKFLVLYQKRLFGKRFGLLQHIPVTKPILLLSNSHARQNQSEEHCENFHTRSDDRNTISFKSTCKMILLHRNADVRRSAAFTVHRSLVLLADTPTRRHVPPPTARG